MKELQDIFNAWAQDYGRPYTRKQWLLSKWDVQDGIEWPPDKIERLLGSIRRGLQLEKKHSLIDLGCGGGWIRHALQSVSGPAWGLDIALGMLKYAQELSGNGRLICGETARLPFRDNAFDRVLCYFVFINMRDIRYVEESLKEIRRILKTGGIALVGQLPDRNGSAAYDRAKKEYLEYCHKVYSEGQNIRDRHIVPVHLFDREAVVSFLKVNQFSFEIRPSFNPFYRPGEPETVPWRFDLILGK